MRIEFYEDATGKKLVTEFLDGLDIKMRQKMLRSVKALQEIGTESIRTAKLRASWTRCRSDKKDREGTWVQAVFMAENADFTRFVQAARLDNRNLRKETDKDKGLRGDKTGRTEEHSGTLRTKGTDAR